MEQDLLGLAFGAGLVAVLNPCGFAMLPAYLALVVRGSGGGSAVLRGSGGGSAVLRAVAATAAMTLGFVVVFGTFGLLTVSAATTIQRWLPYVTVIIGIALVVLGGWLISGRELTGLFRVPQGRGPRWLPGARVGSMFGYGIAYAIASLSCTIGPFLAVTGASLRTDSVVDGLLVYLAYAAGFTLVVGVLAIATALAGTAVIAWLRRIIPYVNRISGMLLILVGLYVGYYGWYEVRLFNADGDPEDPVIAAAGRVQGALAGWVHQHGAWPWLVALAVLLLVSAALLAAIRSKRLLGRPPAIRLMLPKCRSNQRRQP